MDPETHLYLCPRHLARRPGAELVSGELRRLVGGPLWFSAVEVLIRRPGQGILTCVMSLPDLVVWAKEEGGGVSARVDVLLANLCAARPGFAHAAPPARHPSVVMGILNVTPDSFSDGGDHFDPDIAITSGLTMLEAGAGILDIGGESTRPGADPVDPKVEIQRVVPVIQALAERGAVVSIDTRNAAVMTAALEAGARIINDITALTGDPAAISLAARAGVPVVLMHMQGEPQTMQANPRYGHAVLDVYDYLAERIAACRRAGIPPSQICIDPGIGFGKDLEHNLALMDYLALFHGLGTRVLLGASRKSYIGRIVPAGHPKQRLPGSLSAALAAQARGAQIIRVHDVTDTVQALSVASAIDGWDHL
ncbi:MAG: dihydropteroate synthase [Rhodospirillaceae bacterium]